MFADSLALIQVKIINNFSSLFFWAEDVDKNDCSLILVIDRINQFCASIRGSRLACVRKSNLVCSKFCTNNQQQTQLNWLMMLIAMKSNLIFTYSNLFSSSIFLYIIYIKEKRKHFITKVIKILKTFRITLVILCNILKLSNNNLENILFNRSGKQKKKNQKKIMI